jgi:hypothetical protein
MDALGLTHNSRRSLRFAPSKGGAPTGTGNDGGDDEGSSTSADYINRAIGLLVRWAAAAESAVYFTSACV